MPSTRSSRTALWVALGVVGVLVVVVAAFGIGPLLEGSNRQTIVGSLTLVDSDFAGRSAGGSCSGSGGYDDISGGTNVRLSDGAGNVIASSELESGEIERSGRCAFAFVLDDVPDVDFYVIAIGGSQRGDLSYSRSELQEQDWILDLVLGE